MQLFTANQLMTLIAANAAANMVGNDVADQTEATEYGKIFGSLYAAFNEPTWLPIVPALGEGTKAEQDQFKALLAGEVTNILVANGKASQDELNAWSPAFGSFLKAFRGTDWTSKVPAFVGASGPATPVPVGPVTPPPVPA